MNQIQEVLQNHTLKLRPVAWADVNAVARLIYEVCEADGDVTIAVTPEELERQWHTEGFNPETDAFVMETSDGSLAGYAEMFNIKDHAHLNLDAYFHPKFKSIAGALLRRIEERARQEIPLAAPDLKVFARSTIDGKDNIGRSLHEQLGFFPVRYHWRMEIRLKAAPPAPKFPAGIELRPFDRESQARFVWQAENDAFSEHWGMHIRSFEHWSRVRFESSEFDPSLWQVAWQGDEIAGFSQNRFRMGIGWIGVLGVRRPWRKLGLGHALIQQSFGEFYKRGMATVGLGVDASNATGATRLYQRVGMDIVSEFVSFEKELRPGRELEDAGERR